MEKKEIIIKDTERAIYQMHLQEKDSRVTNALKVLFLRQDFYDMLEDYQKALSGNASGVINSFRDIQWDDGLPVIEKFLKNIEGSKYCATLDQRKKRELVSTLSKLLRAYYPYEIFLHPHRIERKELGYDSSLNFNKIFHTVSYEEDFNKYFSQRLLMETPLVGFLSEEEKARPRILQIFCDDNVKKDELKKYIDKHWENIEQFLNPHIDNDEIKNKRDKSSQTFLRDIDMYNSYITMGKIPPNQMREYRVETEFKEKNGKSATGDRIRQLVSEVRALEESVNTEE